MDAERLTRMGLEFVDALAWRAADLAEAESEALDARLRHRAAKAALDLAQAQALTEGRVEGRNEAQRKAALTVMFQDELDELAQLQAEADRAALAAQEARLEYDVTRYQARMVEAALRALGNS